MSDPRPDAPGSQPQRADPFDLASYRFDLPAAQIAQHPAEPRESARLLVIDKATGALAHHTVRDLPALLPPGAVLVVNNTRVVPARLVGHKASGGRVELLLTSPLGGTHDTLLGHEALVRSNKPVREGQVLTLVGGGQARVREAPGGGRAVVDLAGAESLAALLERAGRVPLPPYIRGGSEDDAGVDRDRYQCTYAEHDGAVAAPTAGLHLSAPVLAELDARGVERLAVTLHVGPGTFLPVRDADLRGHRVLGERYEVSAATCAALDRARAEGRPIIAVGTTTTRVLETLAGDAGEGPLRPGRGVTELTILPGHRFAIVSGLMSNFHLPESSLLVLVSAFLGRARALDAYQTAVSEGYRFYSYGDATLMIDRPA